VTAALLLLAIVAVGGLLALAGRGRDSATADLWDLLGWHDQLEHDPGYEGRHRP
jgi:hypothetical protein